MSIENEQKQAKKCFIITPIGDSGSDVFRKVKGVIDSVIKPVLQDYDFVDIKPAYEIMETGMISNQIIERIVNDDLVVANLTGSNPNVMYELAIRHAVAKPIIHICERGTKLPFDIKDNRTAFYTNDMYGVQELRKEFEEYVTSLDYSINYKDNPIYNGLAMTNRIIDMDKNGKSTEAELLQKIWDKLSNERKSHSSEIMSTVIPSHKPRILMKADYLIKTGECKLHKYDMFLNMIEKEMAQLNVEIIGTFSGTICLKNNGNETYELLQNKVRCIAKECGIMANVIMNSDKVPSFQEMLDASLNNEKEG